MPAVNYDLMLQEMLTKTEGKVNQVVYWGRPLDWHNQTLTPNPDAIYFMAFTNTKDVGPVVIEVPPAGTADHSTATSSTSGRCRSRMPGSWEPTRAGRQVSDPAAGLCRTDPRGLYSAAVGHLGGYALLRSNLESHGDADVAKSIAYGKLVKIYPLAQAANPPETVFTDAKDVVFDSTIRYDAVLRGARPHRAKRALAATRPGDDRPAQFARHREGQAPSSPTPRPRSCLKPACAKPRPGWKRSMTQAFRPSGKAAAGPSRHRRSSLTRCKPALPTPTLTRLMRGVAYSYAYVGIKRLGAGQFYLITIKDKDGEAFDGGKTYRLSVPANPPVEQYWSVTAYDRETHALIRNMPRASRSSQIPELQKNADGSIDIFFGPAAPEGKDSNWVPTDPARLRADVPALCPDEGAVREDLGAAGHREGEMNRDSPDGRLLRFDDASLRRMRQACEGSTQSGTPSNGTFGLAPVGEEQAEEGEAVPEAVQPRGEAVAVLDAGGVNDAAEQEALCVDQDVPLAAVDFLACIVAARPAALGRLDRLAVDDGGGGLGVAAGSLSGQNQQGVVQAVQRAVPPPAPEIAEDGALGRELLGQQRPLAAGAQQVEDRVQHRLQVGPARPTDAARRRQARRDQGELGVGQVGCVALGQAGILDPGGIGPHGGVSSLRHETDTTTG